MVSATKSVSLESSSEKSEKLEGQNRTGNSKEPSDFICRVCGSKDFKEVYRSSENIGFGGRNRRIYCVCNGCSVLFEDTDKFSRNRA